MGVTLLGARTMPQPVVKPTINVLIVGGRELSAQVLAHEGHADLEQVERDRQGPRRRLSGRHHGRIIADEAFAIPGTPVTSLLHRGLSDAGGKVTCDATGRHDDLRPGVRALGS